MQLGVGGGLGVCSVYVNLSIMDEGVLVKTNPYKIEGRFIPTGVYLTNSRSLMLFSESMVFNNSLLQTIKQVCCVFTVLIYEFT